MNYARRAVLVLISIVTFFCGIARAQNAPTQTPQSSTIVAWRLPSKIVVRGNVIGLDRLREIANEMKNCNQIQNCLKMESQRPQCRPPSKRS